VPHRRGNTLEIPRPEVLKLEEGSEKSSRAVGDDDPVRLGDSLQSCREVRGLPDNATLLSFARADKIAHYNESRRDPDPHLQWARRDGRELWHCLDQSKSGANRALGIMLVRLGIAEIGQDAVAHILCHETAVALDQCGAAAMIGAHDPPQVLGVEPA
jgi:hypothetical protein